MPRSPVVDPKALLEHDNTILALRELVRRHSGQAKSAGTRLLGKAAATLTARREELRNSVLRRIQTITLAVNVVREVTQMPSAPEGESDDIYERHNRAIEHQRLLEVIELLNQQRELVREWSGRSAKEVFVEVSARCRRLQEEKARKEGKEHEKDEPLRSLKEWRAELNHELDPDAPTYGEGILTWYLAMYLRRLVDEHPEQLRVLDEWWEIAVLVLLTEDHETPPILLGIDARQLPDTLLENCTGDLLGDRSGIRELANIDPETGDETIAERRIRFWLLARRAVSHLAESIQVAAGASRDSARRMSMEAGEAVSLSRPEHEVPQQESHASDFSWMRVGDRLYQFDTPLQRQVVKVLFAERERAGGVDGCGLSSEALRLAAESNASRFRLELVFKRNPALRTILRKTGQTGWGLFLSDPASGEEAQQADGPGIATE